MRIVKDKVTYQMWLHKDLHEELKFIANKYGRSMSDIVYHAIMKEVAFIRKRGMFDTWNGGKEKTK